MPVSDLDDFIRHWRAAFDEDLTPEAAFARWQVEQELYRFLGGRDEPQKALDTT